MSTDLGSARDVPLGRGHQGCGLPPDRSGAHAETQNSLNVAHPIPMHRGESHQRTGRMREQCDCVPALTILTDFLVQRVVSQVFLAVAMMIVMFWEGTVILGNCGEAGGEIEKKATSERRPEASMNLIHSKQLRTYESRQSLCQEEANDGWGSLSPPPLPEIDLIGKAGGKLPHTFHASSTCQDRGMTYRA
jgi:hypothetical protein